MFVFGRELTGLTGIMALVGFILFASNSDYQAYVNIVGAVIIVVCAFIAEYDMYREGG
jgi:uncharacterized membrane protein